MIGSEAPRPELHPMRDFDPSQPAILHDRVTDRIETWTGEHTADFRERSVSCRTVLSNGVDSSLTAGEMSWSPAKKATSAVSCRQHDYAAA